MDFYQWLKINENMGKVLDADRSRHVDQRGPWQPPETPPEYDQFHKMAARLDRSIDHPEAQGELTKLAKAITHSNINPEDIFNHLHDNGVSDRLLNLLRQHSGWRARRTQNTPSFSPTAASDKERTRGMSSFNWYPNDPTDDMAGVDY